MTANVDAIGLDDAHLGQITSIPTPGYNRSELVCGIVHFGVGGFMRAHEAMYVDRLLSAGGSENWAISGIGTRPHDVVMRDALVPQNGLYTLTLKHPDGQVETAVIGSIREYLFALEHPEMVIVRLADPRVKIVSLTITEGGYNVDPSTGEFDFDDEAVAADLEPGALPRTVFGQVTEGLAQRRGKGANAFTVMSCDNIDGNGDLARKAFVSYARRKNPQLGDWMDEHVTFPNSMVDRITPSTPPELRAEVARRTGVDDRWPVVAEPFTQWVLQDRFADGRPEFEKVGVQMVDDVTPYESMKLRLLNAGHQTLAYFGYLLGYRYVHEAASDPLIEKLLRRYMNEEARPTLTVVDGMDIDNYIDTLIERFGNPAVGDTILRIAQNASDRAPTFLVPVINERLAAGGQIPISSAVIASWTRFDEGVDEQGKPIPIDDTRADTLHRLAIESRTEPTAFICDRELFGDLAQKPKFREPYLWALTALREDGAHSTLDQLLD
ncbi:mannitol dehydrogenase family protein [Gordonia jinhuaensis]|uniref:Mannitol-1-phosphate 5-dehydrogenase n=1 Tax=Gordonia jinhuaensis TaxID=1517702 RepID=A0A916WXR1_9ACTN|nr:mannitol dehydrogenase family protein [Gordonia jinhuaensis]GGB38791.1 mannitol 2-dehydrogenase [Gordonia jinhuaensis]